MLVTEKEAKQVEEILKQTEEKVGGLNEESQDLAYDLLREMGERGRG